MESSKKHKRSGSTQLKSPFHPAVVKKRLKQSSHGKFQAKKAQRAEKKNFDTTGAIVTFNTLGAPVAVTPINLVTSGNSAITAVGRSIRMVSVHVRMTVYASNSQASGGVACRLLCLYDKQPNKLLVGLGDIFETTADNTCALMKMGETDRFSVIFDEKFVVSAIGTDSQVYFLDRYCKVNLMSKAAVNSFSGAITGVQEGAVLLIPVCDQNAVGPPVVQTPPGVVSCATRIRYFDV